MKFSRLRQKLVATALVGLCLAGQVFAQDQRLTKRVDLFLKDADLLAATEMLSRQTGIRFVIAPSSLEFKKINLNLPGVTADQAIVYICEAAGGWVERDDQGVYIIRQGAKPESAGTNSSVPTNKVRKPIRIERIKIVKGDPEEVYQMLMTGNVESISGKGFEDLRNAVRKHTEATQPKINDGPTVIFPGVAGAAAYPTVIQGNNALPTDSSRSAAESGADIFLPNESANQRQPGGGGNGAGQPGGGNNQNGNGGSALQGGVGFVPEGIRKVSYDPTTNSLIVEGDDDAIKQLRNLVNLFDQVPKQVIVKVEFITTSQSVTKALGMDWLYQRGAINAGNRPGSFAEVSNPIFINYATGNITTRLRTILSEGGGKTVNAPLVRTLNNQAAIVSQNLQTWYFTSQATNGPGGIIINTIPQQIQIPTTLAIKPRINDDGYITMFLQPTISDLGQIRRDQNGNSFPDISSQSISVVARVKSGQTIALAGLTRKQTRTTVSKFPVLADLPIVGSLFKATNTERNDSELLIFVTPIIVEDQDQGGLGP